MHLAQAKLPSVVAGGEEGLFERMHLYEELCLIVSGLFAQWSALRCSSEWDSTVLPDLRVWVAGQA
jgi:hypothetical protein